MVLELSSFCHKVNALNSIFFQFEATVNSRTHTFIAFYEYIEETYRLKTTIWSMWPINERKKMSNEIETCWHSKNENWELLLFWFKGVYTEPIFNSFVQLLWFTNIEYIEYIEYWVLNKFRKEINKTMHDLYILY